jgi:hypothetical protein
MDSYNRGYGAGLNDNGAGDGDGLGDAIGSGIGSATVLAASRSAPTSAEVAAGFYAVAYNTPYGKVISYRGTDFTPAGDLSTDATQGWPLGGGDYFTPQAALSVEFLDEVQNDNEPGSVILTGHSLGGGLAGFNARLFGNEAVTFDPMTYLRAADAKLPRRYPDRVRERGWDVLLCPRSSWRMGAGR